MPDHARVIIQMRPTPALAAASFGATATAPELDITRITGVELDAGFSPVPIPPRPSAQASQESSFAMASRDEEVEPSNLVVRAAVAESALAELLETAEADPSVVGVFADPMIQPIEAVCPRRPVGTDRDVERLLMVDELQERGMDGAGVKVAVVDSGVNLDYLRMRGKAPAFEAALSWGPQRGQRPGAMPVDHGTMCAYDVCIAAPKCTLIDHALLTSRAQGGSTMDGLLSDAVQSYGLLLGYLSRAPAPFAGDELPRTLVVNNSWGMFHPSWDFPAGDPQNYSDNPEHPFNVIVESLEAAGADILFAAGNCGAECPDGRCEGETDAGIYGANSSAAVTCVAGVVVRNKRRIGYSTTGPGRLERNKPDIASFTHFAGSGVYAADGGTSAATPVAAGVVAAIRRLYPANVLPPARLRQLLVQTAEPQGTAGFDFEYGHGVINVEGLLNELEAASAA